MSQISKSIEEDFTRLGVVPARIEERLFPGETIVVVYVNPIDEGRAKEIALELGAKIQGGFVAVRIAGGDSVAPAVVKSLNDKRVSELVSLLNERSRTSEQQPSLEYVPDAQRNLDIAVTPRHHLIFGRRGVGKTALMLEAKSRLEAQGAATFWYNLQISRKLDLDTAFLVFAERLTNIPLGAVGQRRPDALSIRTARKIRDKIRELSNKKKVTDNDTGRIVHNLQGMFRILSEEFQNDVYIFLDDIHYINREFLPDFLDRVHGVTRDARVWIKAAGIQHQSRYFRDNPPTGLQAGHDAATIELDITLAEPRKARQFLTEILTVYARKASISNLTGVLASKAIDRLVLASGGVPRDCLLLAAAAIQQAKQRKKVKTAGVQDVNTAAGGMQKQKLRELEEDAASSVEGAVEKLNALQKIRNFLIIEKQFTFFRVGYHDKESMVNEYRILQSIMDLRMIHYLNGHVSDQHRAGLRYEAYMFDLSEYSGFRFKKNLRVLDYTSNKLIMRITGANESGRVADSALHVIAFLRQAPIFSLENLSPALEREQ